ncbi:MAG: type II toxin-antitoxin system prevent-host-death family antitoxin [Solirubrobacterales bacterium]|nr:type II toxin-antitoxin system prevent-host-death family antitoxin [Solirubrobacterales bacterium]
MTSKPSTPDSPASAAPPESISTAEAKRRFSELVDRVGAGERFLVSRRGRPAVALVPPTGELLEAPAEPPGGLAATAGALADWDDLEDAVAAIYAARRASVDRPAPDLG